jgi:hypothetical protein
MTQQATRPGGMTVAKPNGRSHRPGARAGLADCHYNLARAYESLGKPRQAIRHLAQYRRLTGEERD